MKQHNQLTAHEILKIAVECELDPRAVQRFLNGKTVRPSTRILVNLAMKRLGIEIGLSGEKNTVPDEMTHENSFGTKTSVGS